MLRSALLNVMIKAARKASRTLKRDFGEIEHLQASLKGPANFVTAADQRAEEILREELEHARPGYGFLGEEGGAREGSDKTHRWIVDPLDGTLNFLHGIPHFAISIGLEREGTMVAGLVYNPVTDELFTAERGKGAFLNDQRLRVAARKRLGDAVVACALPHPSRGDVELTRKEHSAVQDRVAGLRPLALGHGGRHRAGARSRRLRDRPRRTRRHDQNRRHSCCKRGDSPADAAGAQERARGPVHRPALLGMKHARRAQGPRLLFPLPATNQFAAGCLRHGAFAGCPAVQRAIPPRGPNAS
jgi:myo-inositol-1(or 4)-monophosphatase